MFFFTLPAFALWGATEPILLHVFRQDADLSAQAAQFVLWLIPGLVPFVIVFCLQRFLIAQDITTPIVVCGTIVVPFREWD